MTTSLWHCQLLPFWDDSEGPKPRGIRTFKWVERVEYPEKMIEEIGMVV